MHLRTSVPASSASRYRRCFRRLPSALGPAAVSYRTSFLVLALLALQALREAKPDSALVFSEGREPPDAHGCTVDFLVSSGNLQLSRGQRMLSLWDAVRLLGRRHVSSVFLFPSLDLSLDLKISLGLCARKDAEGLRKALLRGRARQLRKPPCQKNTLVERDFNLDQLLYCTLPGFRSSSSGSLVPWNACGPQLPRGVSVMRQEGFMLLRKGSLAKGSAEGHAEGTTCSDSKRANASKRGRLRKQWRKGGAEDVFASLGLKQNKKHSSCASARPSFEKDTSL